MRFLGSVLRPGQSRVLAAGALSACLLLSGCSGEGEKSSGQAGHAQKATVQTQKAPAPMVDVSKVKTSLENRAMEWAAETKAPESVEVRARVEGTLEHFSFKEGQGVRAGQVLFTIDDAPYQADLMSARANVAKAQADLDYARAQVNVRKAKADLASAQASLNQAQQDVDRYKPLAKDGVIPQQTLDNAIAKRDVARAQMDAAVATLQNTELSDKANIEVAAAGVEAALAQVTQAQLNIDYCTITSPVDGCIGKLQVDPGNLVGQAGSNQVLVTISKLDPMYVNFSVSESVYLWIMEHRKDEGQASDFSLVLSDGTKYPYKGKFGMLDRAVSSTTGTIGMRIVFPNPDYLLREGQFCRLLTSNKTPKQVVIVPQRAVMTSQSARSVYVVGAENKVESRNVEVGNTLGECFVINSGLRAGELVVVEGVNKVKPGVVCRYEVVDYPDATKTSPSPASSPVAGR